MRDKNRAGFSLAGAMILLLVVSAIMAATIPMLTKLASDKTKISAYTKDCIVNEGAADLTSRACAGAIAGCKNGLDKDCNTLFFYADTYESETYKVAKKVCDENGQKACKFLMDQCVSDANDCDLDTTNDLNDIAYYLALAYAADNSYKSYITTLGTAYYGQGMTNFKTKVQEICDAEFAATQTLNSIACVILGREEKTHTFDFDVADRGLYNEEDGTDGTTFSGGVVALLTQTLAGGAPPDPDNAHPANYKYCAGQTVTTLSKATTGLAYDLKVTNCNVATATISYNEVNPGGSPVSGCWYGKPNGVCTGTGCGNDLGNLGGTATNETDKFLCTHDKAVAACEALNLGVNYGTGCTTSTGCNHMTKGWRLPTDHELKRWRADYNSESAINATIKSNLDLCNSQAGSPLCTFYAGCSGANGGICNPYGLWASDKVGNTFGNFWLYQTTNLWHYDNADPTDWAISVRCVRSVDPPTTAPPDPDDAHNGTNYRICANPQVATLAAADTGLTYDLYATKCNVATTTISYNEVNPGGSPTSGCWYGIDTLSCTEVAGCGNDLGNLGGTATNEFDKFLCTHDKAVEACEAMNLGENYGTGCTTATGCDKTTSGWRLPDDDEIFRWQTTYGAQSAMKTSIYNAMALCSAYDADGPNCQAYTGCTGAHDPSDSKRCLPNCIWTSIQNGSLFGNAWLVTAGGIDYWTYAVDDEVDWALGVRCIRTKPEPAGTGGTGEYFVTTTALNSVQDIDIITSVDITETVSNPNSATYWLVSFDGKAHDDTTKQWKKMTAACTFADATTTADLATYEFDTAGNANTATQIETWMVNCIPPTGTNTLDFAIDLATTDGTTLPSVDTITVNYYPELE